MELLTSKQVAAIVGVKPGTIRDWNRTGKMPKPKDINGVTRWLRSDIEAWINQQGKSDGKDD